LDKIGSDSLRLVTSFLNQEDLSVVLILNQTIFNSVLPQVNWSPTVLTSAPFNGKFLLDKKQQSRIKRIHQFAGGEIELPESLTHLILSPLFNQALPEHLPESLTHLILSPLFNQALPAHLPKSLTHLTIGTKFNQPLPAHLPESLILLLPNNQSTTPQEYALDYAEQQTILAYWK
jgi:hypothetical protein